MKLLNIWNFISDNGVKAEQSFDVKKRIRIINQFCAIGFLFTFPAVIIFFCISAQRQALIEFALVLAWITVFLITKKHYITGAFFMIFSMSAILLLIAMLYGNVGAEYFYFSLFILSFYLFRNKIILSGLLIYLITLFATAKLFQHKVVLSGKDADIAPVIYIVNIVLSFLSGALFLRLFILEHERYMRQIEEKNDLLNLALNDANHKQEEIKLLLKELSHRTKNSLQLVSSLINIQANKLSDEGARKALLDGKNRIISIALLHKKLYQNDQITTVSFKEYVDDLVLHLRDIFEDKSDPVEINKDIDDYEMKIDNAVTLGLILNELLTNSFKHGLNRNNRKFINISIHKVSEEILSIDVSDSGTGIEKLATENSGETLGIGLITSLVKQMDGSIGIISSRNAVNIRLKYNL